MVKYFGDKYFSEKWFICEVRSKEIYINNTNCLFIKDTSFDTFYLIREIIKDVLLMTFGKHLEVCLREIDEDIRKRTA